MHDIIDSHDPETGEAVRSYAVVKVARGQLRWAVLRADQIDSRTVENPSWFNAKVPCRALHQWCADHKGRPDDEYFHRLGVATRLAVACR